MSRFLQARTAAGLSVGQVCHMARGRLHAHFNASELVHVEQEGSIDTELLKFLSEIYHCGTSYLDGTFSEADLSDRAKRVLSKFGNGHDRAVILNTFMMIESKDGPIDGAVVCDRTGF